MKDTDNFQICYTGTGRRRTFFLNVGTWTGRVKIFSKTGVRVRKTGREQDGPAASCLVAKNCFFRNWYWYGTGTERRGRAKGWFPATGTG